MANAFPDGLRNSGWFPDEILGVPREIALLLVFVVVSTIIWVFSFHDVQTDPPPHLRETGTPSMAQLTGTKRYQFSQNHYVSVPCDAVKEQVETTQWDEVFVGVFDGESPLSGVNLGVTVNGEARTVPVVLTAKDYQPGSGKTCTATISVAADLPERIKPGGEDVNLVFYLREHLPGHRATTDHARPVSPGCGTEPASPVFSFYACLDGGTDHSADHVTITPVR